MKKFISVIMAVIMLLVMTMPAFAVDISTRDSTNIEFIDTTEEKSKLESIFDSICDFFAQIIEFIMNIFKPEEKSDGNYYYIYFQTGQYYNGIFPDTVGEEKVMSGEHVDIEIPVPEKYGYKFVGWEPEVPKIMPTNDVVCVAQWEQLEGYSTIYIDIPEGAYMQDITWTKKELTQKVGTEVKMPRDPIMNNYAFEGWSPKIPSNMPEEDITVTAIWRKKTDVKVTWKVRDENGEWVEIVQYYDYGEEIDPIFIIDDWPSFTEDGVDYYFDTWLPELPETVTEDATYVANYVGLPQICMHE